MKSEKILVTGAGGFIGQHLVRYLKSQGYWVKGVDLKKPEYSKSAADEFDLVDLREKRNTDKVTEGINQVYGLAADMGGIGFITSGQAEPLRNNLLINLNMIESARKNKIKKYFYSSSACVYPNYRQEEANLKPLKEDEIYPADPQHSYGWEKLTTERLFQDYHREHGMDVHIARFHNTYGPEGAWDGGREKAPAAMCRKIAKAKLTNNPEVEIWGDGEQTRSFCYIDDLVVGIHKVMNCSVHEPLNIGHTQLISINDMAKLIATIAKFDIKIKHIEGPQGVRGRNSDNTNLKAATGWEPSISLEEGLTKTYQWIEGQVKQNLASVR